MAVLFPELQKVITRSPLDKDEQKALIYILRAAIPNVVHATADQTVAGTTMTNSDYLTFTNGLYPNGGPACMGGKAYILKGVLLCTAVATNGIKIDFDNSTATFSDANINYCFTVADQTGASNNTTAIATDGSTTTAAVRVEIDGWLECSSSGTLGLRFAEQANSTGVPVLEGSYLTLQEVFV